MKEKPVSFGIRCLAVLVGCGLFGVVFHGALGGSWSAGQAPFPFIWRDVALVHLAWAAPLAWILATGLRRWTSALLCIHLAAALMVAGAVPLVEGSRDLLLDTLLQFPVLGAALRILLALILTLATTLLGLVLISFQPAHESTRRRHVALALVALVVLILLPAIYVAARCRHDLGQVGELVGQERFGEAHALATSLRLLDLRHDWEGHTPAEVTAELERRVEEIQARLAIALSADAPAEKHLERVRDLARLGHTVEALALLQSLNGPQAANLRGTIHEARCDWELGLASYRLAREGWEPHAPSPARLAGLTQATLGMAYCQQRAGRYAEAEALYLDLLTLAPSADTHFRLAQFYRDSGDAENSQKHARRAMTLAPARYHAAGEALIRRLSVYQFGCLRVFAVERPR